MIVGRRREKELLERVFESRKAQLVTVYGRRRVGKTYLIDQFFSEKNCKLMQVAGTKDGVMKEQLYNFAKAFSETFLDNVPIGPLQDWRHAFNLLRQELDKTSEKVVVFLDELPWLASKKSGFMRVFEHDWNRYFSRMPHVIFVVCGSSASWILKKIIFNKGGLHNRTTCEIRVSPFNLHEAKEYLKEMKNIEYTDKQVLALYMAIGGIPYYLEYVEPGQSAAENIQHMFFVKNAPLKYEFHKLFESLFEKASTYMSIVRTIATKRAGVHRAFIVENVKEVTMGGALTAKLKNLEEAGFITSYVPLGYKKKGEYYRLTDEFCAFYLYWVNEAQSTIMDDYWVQKHKTPEYRAWSGYTFETICLSHIQEIARALNIKAAALASTWRYIPSANEDGAQIDLVIDRDDDAITLCEIKYVDKPFTVDKSYAQALQRKMQVFKQQTETEKVVFQALIVSNGVKNSVYLQNLVHSVVLLKDLFKPL